MHMLPSQKIICSARCTCDLPACHRLNLCSYFSFAPNPYWRRAHKKALYNAAPKAIWKNQPDLSLPLTRPQVYDTRTLFMSSR